MDLLGRVAVESGWRIHAYVVITRHYHVVVEAPVSGLSRGMRQLNGLYSRRFNLRHGQIGPLFDGRFRSVAVPDPRRLDLLRALMLKPVRAHLVDTAAEWPWSSYAATAGDVAAPSWLDTSWTLSQFGGPAARYREFIASGALWLEDGVVPSPTPPPRFPVDDVITACLRVLGVTQSEIIARPRRRRRERARLAYGLRRFAGLTGAEIAPLLHVTKWHASKLARRGEVLSKSDGMLAAIESGLQGLGHTPRGRISSPDHTLA